MNHSFSQYTLIEYGSLSENDFNLIRQCRGDHNKLGFAYQLIFIKLLNRAPIQSPFEIIDEIVVYAGAQLFLDSDHIARYSINRKKIFIHQQTIIDYLQLHAFSEQTNLLKDFIFQQALQFEPISLLYIKSIEFLRHLKILLPAEDTLLRIVRTQRTSARQLLFDKIHTRLSPDLINKLDALLETTSDYTPIEELKSPVKNASPETILNLIERAECIMATGALQIDLTHVNNNYQRTLANEINRCSADRIRKMEPTRRYTALICFLQQAHQNYMDLVISSYIKVMNAAYTRSDTLVENQLKRNEALIKESLENYEEIKGVIRDQTIPDIKLRQALYERFSEELERDLPEMRALLKEKKIQIFNALTNKYSYFRQFTPRLFALLDLQSESKNTKSNTLHALEILKQLNAENKRILPQQVPLEFIPKKLRKAVINDDGTMNKHAWESALYLQVRDEIKQGNINAAQSKRYLSIRSFFIADEQMELIAPEFFRRSGFPKDPSHVKEYFTNRLRNAYLGYFDKEPDNDYAQVKNGKWVLSTDPAETLTPEQKKKLDAMKSWLNKRMRPIKLPALLIEADNDIHFTQPLTLPGEDGTPSVDAIFGVLATLMAHGCNIGPYTMSKLIEGITYKEICRITDWQLTNDAMRVALSWIVNTMSKLGVTKHWGTGKTSSSDAHLKTFNQKVAQQSYQARIGDFALAFYTFVADNYAPFHSKPFDCAEGEAHHVLDGFLYNESDLSLDEHYTDTRAAATLIFSAFGWYGKKYSPRIRGVKNHRMYMLDPDMDYGNLAPLLKHKNAKISLALVEKYWMEMAQFYASIEQGKVTASVALRRLLSLSKKNEFYKANLYLGRILKTEHILAHMSDQEYRRNKHRGLLKGEEIHQLARDINYANRGKITAREPKGQIINCNSLTIIMACVIYWQAKELDRLISTDEFAEMGFDPSLVKHVSPVGWDNVVLYGEYIINKLLINQ